MRMHIACKPFTMGAHTSTFLSPAKASPPMARERPKDSRAQSTPSTSNSEPL